MSAAMEAHSDVFGERLKGFFDGCSWQVGLVVGSIVNDKPFAEFLVPLAEFEEDFALKDVNQIRRILDLVTPHEVESAAEEVFRILPAHLTLLGAYMHGPKNIEPWGKLRSWAIAACDTSPSTAARSLSQKAGAARQTHGLMVHISENMTLSAKQFSLVQLTGTSSPVAVTLAPPPSRRTLQTQLNVDWLLDRQQLGNSSVPYLKALGAAVFLSNGKLLSNTKTNDIQTFVPPAQGLIASSSTWRLQGTLTLRVECDVGLLESQVQELLQSDAVRAAATKLAVLEEAVQDTTVSDNATLSLPVRVSFKHADNHLCDYVFEEEMTTDLRVWEVQLKDRIGSFLSVADAHVLDARSASTNNTNSSSSSSSSGMGGSGVAHKGSTHSAHGIWLFVAALLALAIALLV